jgi:ABC-type molybdate transport system substrate-binding protein
MRIDAGPPDCLMRPRREVNGKEMTMATRNNSKARTEVLDMLKEDQKVKKAFRDAQRLDSGQDAQSLKQIVE